MSEIKKTKTLPARSEIKLEDTWDLEAIFATDEAWEQEYQQVKELLKDASDYQETLGESAEHLYRFLQFQDNVFERFNKVYVYAHMKHDQDTSNSFYQGLDDRAKSLYTQILSALSFVTPEILSIEEEKLQAYLAENEELGLYKHYINQINLQRPHVLSESEEALLAKASEVFNASSNTFSMLNNADLTFPTITDDNGEEVEVTHGRYSIFLESKDRRVRKDAFEAVYSTYGKYLNTFSSTLAGVVKKQNFIADVRHFDSARQAALNDNAIPEQVYDNLVQTVNNNLHLLHRYTELRKKVLEVDELHMYDMYAPLVKEVDMNVTYEEAKDYILKGLAPLGEDYLRILQEGFNNRWVDVHENKGKRSGAYSSGTYGTNPYILMNWQDNVNNLYTLAHEFGHSLHSYYTTNTQPHIYGDYSIFVAEVASTCNENLLTDYLLNTLKDDKQRLYILNYYLEGFRGTVFRQTMFAEFEQLIHQKAKDGVALTAEYLTEEYYKLNKKYFGENVHIDEEIGREWARIPHFYYNFYVYQYATGFSAASALSKAILEEGQPAVERYIDFLKSGSSDYPIEVLKKAGVDMTKAEPIEEALKVFEEKLNEMERLLS